MSTCALARARPVAAVPESCSDAGVAVAGSPHPPPPPPQAASISAAAVLTNVRAARCFILTSNDISEFLEVVHVRSLRRNWPLHDGGRDGRRTSDGDLSREQGGDAAVLRQSAAPTPCSGGMAAGGAVTVTPVARPIGFLLRRMAHCLV